MKNDNSNPASIKKNFTSKTSSKGSGTNSLENSLNAILKPIFSSTKKEFVIINNLIKNWPEIIGKKYSKFCHPQLVNFNKDHKSAKLTVVAYNSAISFFIENNSELILERIASLYGFKTINKITVKQQPKNIKINQDFIKLSASDEQIIQNKIQKIADQSLAQTIADLGRDIIHGSKKITKTS